MADDFADFTTSTLSTAAPEPTLFTPSGASGPIAPASPWYALWERHALSEFQTEGIVLATIIIIVLFHYLGTRSNRRIAHRFISSILPTLSSEFAFLGYHYTGVPNTLAPPNVDPLLAQTPKLDVAKITKETSPTEFGTYASGRVNIAAASILLALKPRNNPVAWFGETFASFIFDSLTPPRDIATITFAAPASDAPAAAGGKYTGFVFALVNKRNMKRIRNERYDVSLTRTSDCAEIPWAAVMTESKEISDAVLSADLVAAVKALGQDAFEAVVISDAPTEKPERPEELEGALGKRRVEVSVAPSEAEGEKVEGLVKSVVKLMDALSSGKGVFRENVVRKIKATREEEGRKLRRKVEEEGKEEREAKLAEKKKEEREKKLRGMTAEQQRKFLEKERDREQKKGVKKMTR